MNTSARFALILSLTVPTAERLAAQDQPARGPGPRQLEKFLERFPESDLNKDGKVTAEEASEFRKKQGGRRPAGTDDPRGRPFGSVRAYVQNTGN